jgi:hypothetical protein
MNIILKKKARNLVIRFSQHILVFIKYNNVINPTIHEKLIYFFINNNENIFNQTGIKGFHIFFF